MRTKTNKSTGRKSVKKEEHPLQELFINELKDIFWAEKHLVKSLPKMARAANDESLKEAVLTHLEETKSQVERLEKVFRDLGLKAIGKKCHAMEGLVKEAEEVIDEMDKGYVRDSALIISAQKVEHYEIASYGSLRTLAELMELNDIADLLQESLDEEGDTNKKLTELAVSSVNEEAAEEEISK